MHRLAKDLGVLDVDDIHAMPFEKLLDWHAFYALEEEAYEDMRLQRSAKDVLTNRPKLPVR